MGVMLLGLILFGLMCAIIHRSATIVVVRRVVGTTEIDNIDAEGACVEVGAIVVGPKKGTPASSVESAFV